MCVLHAPCAMQEGSVDEVSFIAPELGPLAAVLVAPEGGSWVCDEVDVYSSRSNHTDRYAQEACFLACAGPLLLLGPHRGVGMIMPAWG
jgi:hypothetical protein